MSELWSVSLRCVCFFFKKTYMFRLRVAHFLLYHSRTKGGAIEREATSSPPLPLP